MVTLTGKIIDKVSGQPLPKAEIVVTNENKKPLSPKVAAFADEQGAFSLRVPDDAYITVFYVDYPLTLFQVDKLTSKQEGAETAIDTVTELENGKSLELSNVKITKPMPASKQSARKGNKTQQMILVGACIFAATAIIGYIIYQSNKK